MATKQYSCRDATCREDLTAAVQAALNANPMVAARMVPAPATPVNWRVQVIRGKGHSNVFADTQTGTVKGGVEEVIGLPPTITDTLLATTASTLSPDKTLDRLDTFAQYLLGLGGTVSIFLTGFGVITPTAQSSWVFMPMTLFCLSLGLAVTGMTPRQLVVNVNGLNAPQFCYNTHVQRRAAFVWLAGLLFAAGLFSIPVFVLLSK